MATRFVVCREKQTAGRYRTLNFTGTLLTRARNGNNEFAVFLGNKIFCGAGGAAVCVFFLDFNDQLFGWFETLPPVGESIGVAAFFTSSGVRLTSSILEIFSPASA